MRWWRNSETPDLRGRIRATDAVRARIAVGSRSSTAVVLSMLALATGCGPGSGVASVVSGLSSHHQCVEDSPRIALPAALDQSSGVAAGSGDFFWSHNDSGYPAELFAVTPGGELFGVVTVTESTNVDWEDLAAGPCPTGAGEGRCLYIADLGDNAERRIDLAIYRVPEPQPDDSASLPAQRFPIRLPHGPRDIEALYLLEGERLFLITKGRSAPIEVYRVPPLERPGQPLTPERIQILADRPRFFSHFVTGAAASPDGEWVAVRTYQTLEFFRPREDGTLEPSDLGRVNLLPLREPQGEAVALLDSGRVVLTSEAGPGLALGSMRVLRCGGLGGE